MNCYKHPEVAAVAFCRTCGRALCGTCQRPFQGTVVCEEHAPSVAPMPPPTPLAAGTSPGLAFVLGLIPGVGAIYNGQYAKGIVHVVIFGLLISVMSSGAAHGFEPLFGFLLAIWYFYMPFEAYHTARRRQLGEQVDEFSSIVPLRPARAGFPVGPVLLIVLGVLFLLTTMDVVELRDIVRWWPLALIGLGIYMLFNRLAGSGGGNMSSRQEVSHDER